MLLDEGQASRAAEEAGTPSIKRAGMLAGVAVAAGALAACNDEQLGPPTPEAAACFLSQAGLGATQAAIDQVTQLGFGGWLDQQFAMPLSDSLWSWMQAQGFQAVTYKSSDMGMDQALWYRLINSPDVLRQRVVLALSQIFVVSVRNMPVPWGQWACVAYWELLEANCFGNFRTLLERMALSPAMGVYLSMRGSRKEDASGRQPDENFARELLQLFTIGLVQLNADGTPKLDASGQPIDTYSNADVTEVARHPKVFSAELGGVVLEDLEPAVWEPPPMAGRSSAWPPTLRAFCMPWVNGMPQWSMMNFPARNFSR